MSEGAEVKQDFPRTGHWNFPENKEGDIPGSGQSLCKDRVASVANRVHLSPVAGTVEVAGAGSEGTLTPGGGAWRVMGGQEQGHAEIQTAL